MTTWTLCLNTSTIRPAPLDEKIRIASAAGFQAIEPWVDEIDAHLRANSSDSFETVARRIRDAGLVVPSMIALGGWIDAAEGAELEVALEECRRRFELAAALGSPTIVASPPLGAVDLEHAARRYSALVALGKSFDVSPAMEFLGFTQGVHTLAQAWTIAQDSGAEHPLLVADTYHLLRGGGSIEDLATIRGNQMSIFHINDLPADPPVRDQTDHDRVMLGEGVLDLPRVVTLLRQINYRGPVSLELFNKILWQKDPETVARRGAERLQELIDG
jgi:sugar phosphate isomerase/epimerase